MQLLKALDGLLGGIFECGIWPIVVHSNVVILNGFDGNAFAIEVII
jgi:hypothetical protein